VKWGTMECKNYFGTIKCKNVKIFMDVFSSIQNVRFFMGWVRAFWLFFWPLEAKIQNGE
jgi:hypothetical protein